MMKNKGFGKFEVFTLIVIIICITTYFMYLILDMSSEQKMDTMKKNAIVLARAVMTNRESFSDEKVIYLDEIVEQKFLDKIKSPFSSGYCDMSESKVELIDDKAYVTLKCDDYLIDNTLIRDNDKMDIYNVSEWTLKKPSGEFQEKVLYNCLKDNREIYDNYEEEEYMIFKIGEAEGEKYYSISELNTCTSINKTYYRTKVLVK